MSKFFNLAVFAKSYICILMLLLSGCNNCDRSTKKAENFIQNIKNQKCNSTQDCTIVNIGCSYVKGAYCNQIVLNLESSKSKEWSKIKKGLESCEDNCNQCTALIEKKCGPEGYCFRY